MMIDWRICVGFVQIAICNYLQQMEETSLEKCSFYLGNRLIDKLFDFNLNVTRTYQVSHLLYRVYFHTSGKKEEKAEFVK